MSNKSEKAMVNLTIDGQDVQVEAGATIINAAEKLGIKIPTMCYLKKLSPTGACRVCLVDVEGVAEPVTACNTVAVDGIVVTTQTPLLEKKRKDMIRLMLVNHPLDCPVCDAAGECDLQDICFDFHVLDQPFSAEDVAMPKINSWPLIENVPSRCILCEKCVKVGRECTGIGDFKVVERGDKAYIACVQNNKIDPYMEGNAVAVCPVGAMISKPFKHSARSWTLDKVPSIGFAGGSLEQVDLNVKQDKLFRITSTDEVTVNDGLLSFDSSFGYGFVNSPARLLTPRLKQQGEVDWATAQQAVLTKAKEFGGAAVAGLSSARLTVEENYLFQKLFRAGFGSNNIDSDARFGMQKSAKVLKKLLGLRGASAPSENICAADAILVFGSDITSEQPQINYKIQKALQKNDAQLIVANMRNVRIAGLAHTFLNYQPGSEVALAGALTKLIVSNGQSAAGFIKKYVKNSADVKKALAAIDLKKVVKETGVTLELLQDAAAALGTAANVAIIFGADVTKSVNCTDITGAIANLAIVAGVLGTEAGGLFPVDERPNTQGLLDAGVCPEQLPGYQDYATASAKFAKSWGVANLPADGKNALEILAGIESGAVKFLYLAGTNPLVTFADSGRWKKALAKVEFLVVQDILDSELTQMADVVLPAAAYGEKSGTYIACDHRAGMLGKANKPAGESLSDKQIFAELLGAITTEQTLCNEKILAEMAELTQLFSSVEVTGKTYTSSCAKPVYAPLPAALTFVPFGKSKAVSGLQLLTGKMHAHTGVTSTFAAGAMDIAPAGYIEINKQDAEKAGVAEGAMVTVTSATGSATGVARISKFVPAGLVFAPYHFAELNAQQVMPSDANMVSVELQKV
jgi:formate dehydrogenase alpha subunit